MVIWGCNKKPNKMEMKPSDRWKDRWLRVEGIKVSIQTGIGIRLGTVWYWFQDAVINEVHFLINISIKRNRLFSKWYWNPMMNTKQENEAWKSDDCSCYNKNAAKTWNNGNYLLHSRSFSFCWLRMQSSCYQCSWESRSWKKVLEKMKTKPN